jgi:hypothetical protein
VGRQLDDGGPSEDGHGKLDMTERIRKARKQRIKEEAEEAGYETKTISVPLKPGERVSG